MKQKQHFEMQSERLAFRRLRADDYVRVAPILKDPQTMYAWEHGFSYEEICDWIADMLRRYQEDGCGYFAAFDKESRQLASLAGPLVEALPDGPEIGLGYIVRRDLWGQGLGTECARACLDYAFTRLDAPRVVAAIRVNNLPSLHVAAHCRMRPIGQFTKQYRGKALPHVLCAVTREVYQAPEPASEDIPAPSEA